VTPAQAYGGGGGLAAPALAGQGIPEPAAAPAAAAPTDAALSEIVQMLRGGQVGAERFMELLSLLTQSTLPQLQQAGMQAPQPQQSPAAGPGGTDLTAMLAGR